YVTAKHGLIGLVKVVAKEGAAHGVRDNVICPGFVRTPLADKQIREQSKELGISEEDVIKKVMLKDTVDGEFATVEDVAETALFLLVPFQRAHRPIHRGQPRLVHAIERRMSRNWVGLASADHVRTGRSGGFMQLGHGKAAPLRRLQPGDQIVYYSPTEVFRDKQKLQAFTAIGIVKDRPPYRVDMANGLRAY